MTSAELLNLLAAHRGAANGVHVARLEAATGVPARRLRSLISELRLEGVAVCGKPETGYLIAETSAEIEEFCAAYLEKRALHSLQLSSRLRGIALPVLAGQLFLNNA